MLLWLQRACASDITVAVKRCVMLVDVYKPLAKLIISVDVTAARGRRPIHQPLKAPEPHSASTVWGKIYMYTIIIIVFIYLYIYQRAH